jgi:hypothetical protein
MLDAAAASVTEAQLRDHAGLLADDVLEGREAGTRGGLAAARYLAQQLAASGLQPAGASGSFVQRFGNNYQNLLGLLPGTDPELRDQYVLVGAHYDHVGYGSPRTSHGPFGLVHNGADDNASGVAALLEVIEGLQQVGLQPRRSLLFVFWDGEEQGLLGSKHWVAHPTLPLHQLSLAVNVDMVGRMVDHRLEIGGTRTGAGLRQLVSRSDLPGELWLDFDWELKQNSDHWPLMEAEFPAIYLHTGVHDDYHRPSDDVEKLNLPGIRLASAYLVRLLVGLADEPALPAFRRAARAETPATRRHREAPLPMPRDRLGIAGTWRSDEGGYLEVERIDSLSPAANSDLRHGDRIVAINGRPLDDPQILPAVVLVSEREVQLKVLRRSSQAPPPHPTPAPTVPSAATTATTATTVAADRQGVSMTFQLAGEPSRLGLAWREDPGDPRAVLVTRVLPASAAARSGLAVLDRIRAIDGESIVSQDALLERIRAAIEGHADSLVLQIERKGRVSQLQVDLQWPFRQDRAL